MASQWTVERALEALVEALDEGVLVFDGDHRCRAAGRSVAEIFGVDPRTLPGAKRSEILAKLALATEAPDTLLATLGDDALTGTSTTVDPIAVVRPHPRTVVWTSVPIVAAGASAGRIDIVRDVTSERRAESAHEEMAKRLEEATAVDEATGLANRRAFEREADREHRQSQRAWLPYAVVAFHVGPADATASDDLLKRAGEVLRLNRREYDVVGRWDGPDLIVLLPGADGAATRTIIKRAFASAKEALGPDADVTLTAGAAVWTPPSGEGPTDLVRRARHALTAALAKGLGSREIDVAFGEWKDEMSEG